MKPVKCPIMTDMVIVDYRIKDKVCHKILMAPITEREEFILDSEDFIELNIRDRNVVIPKKKVYFYGSIDFTEGSNDLDTIRDMNLIIRDGMQGVCIPAYYNYNEHIAVSTGKTILYYDTLRTDVILKYKHGCLGKPEKVIVWQESKKV